MDGLMLHQLVQMEAEEEEEENEDYVMEAAAATLLIYAGAEESRLARARNRQPNRLYLCRPQLCPNPHIDTPWQHLYNSRSDRAFITTMGFDVQTFESILLAGFAEKYYASAIPRNDVDSVGASRPGRRSLDATGAPGLVLHYLNSTMHEISLQQIFALIPSSVSRYNKFALNILLETIRQMSGAAITWPRRESEFEDFNSLIVHHHPRLLGAF